MSTIMERFSATYGPKAKADAEREPVKKIDRNEFLRKKGGWPPSLFEMFRGYRISLGRGKFPLDYTSKGLKFTPRIMDLPERLARLEPGSDDARSELVKVFYVREMLKHLVRLDGRHVNDEEIRSMCPQVDNTKPEQILTDLDEHFDVVLPHLVFFDDRAMYQSAEARRFTAEQREYFEDLAENMEPNKTIRDNLLKFRAKALELAELAADRELREDDSAFSFDEASREEIIKKELASLEADGVRTASDFMSMHHTARRHVCNRLGIPERRDGSKLKLAARASEAAALLFETAEEGEE